ncbi:hypothetical protein Pedsa_0405 [Pseudopedobacter saltans DSM 12145]|uniref:DUF4369 domain-containing protein n=1 Tax=Pseudopedobacter saltans (strain ATCC 51119 / DSM 12145 / JCM 21818 / CCUG 39354 / LMG 10337 / NBRC 100064 / NCIMB 13643) TaxID=762903 RepID=F0S570_PSESL|nr:hypothetical protein [Pseudopedobacter saltans]ADY50987.1 hypothetical protein Pedsa_0405 [Pseudopedobacter saltans DSM 12145]
MAFKYIFWLPFILNVLNVNAQDTIKVVLKDTIQIHGTIRYLDNTPATNLYIRSKTHPDNIQTFTDNLGKFTLKNALFQDTLLIGPASKPNFPYKGSRFIDIVIPQYYFELPPLEKTEKRIHLCCLRC